MSNIYILHLLQTHLRIIMVEMKLHKTCSCFDSFSQFPIISYITTLIPYFPAHLHSVPFFFKCSEEKEIRVATFTALYIH